MDKTHFGYEQVSPDEKTRRVRGVFDSVAGKYDLMNDLMSAGLHRAWKRFAVELSGTRTGSRVLDLAGGTATSHGCSTIASASPEPSCIPTSMAPCSPPAATS